MFPRKRVGVPPLGEYPRFSDTPGGAAFCARSSLGVLGRREQRRAAAALLGFDADAHPGSDRIRFAINDVGGHPQPALFGELDDRDHVRRWDLGVVRVVVDRVGEHRATPGYRPRHQRAAAFAAFAGGEVHPARAIVAMFDEQLRCRLARHEQYSTLYWFGCGRRVWFDGRCM